MEFYFVKKIRDAEIGMVLRRMKQLKPEGSRVLEIGAGGGWQALRLSEGGFRVDAIDIESSRYRNDRYYDVIEFNGVNIPFPDNTFDIIFSSNVLEHVGNPGGISVEISRCLKGDGVQLHLVPSATWRVFTTLTYYLFVIKYISSKFIMKMSNHKSDLVQPTKKWNWYSKLFPSRHGEKGNVLTETWWFSRWGWDMNFRQWGLPLTRTGSNQLFYTGYSLLGEFLNMKIRRLLSYLFGSTCHIYEGSKKLT